MQTHGEASENPVRVTDTDVRQARTKSEAKQTSYNIIKKRIDGIVRQERRLKKQIRSYHRVALVRRLCDRAMTRTGGLIVAEVSCSSLLLIITRILHVQIYLGIVIIVGGLSALAWWGKKLFTPSDGEVASSISRWEQKLGTLALSRVEAEREGVRARKALQDAEAEYFILLEVYNSCINQLLRCDWQGMTGIAFENFLVAVFRELGHKVETTKVTGDQGVDLIVSKDNRKIAIQAKGYPNSTVGNKAVQEAHTGMAFYNCQAAAVITNSTYTSAARELALRVGCILIEGQQIPDLIKGEIQI